MAHSSRVYDHRLFWFGSLALLLGILLGAGDIRIVVSIAVLCGLSVAGALSVGVSFLKERALRLDAEAEDVVTVRRGQGPAVAAALDRLVLSSPQNTIRALCGGISSPGDVRLDQWMQVLRLDDPQVRSVALEHLRTLPAKSIDYARWEQMLLSDYRDVRTFAASRHPMAQADVS